MKVCWPELNLVVNVCMSSSSLGLNLISLLCLSRMETLDVLRLVLSRWTNTLNLEYLFPHRLEAQNVVVSVAASKAGYLVSVIVSLDMPETVAAIPVVYIAPNECVCSLYQDWDSELGVSVCIPPPAQARDFELWWSVSVSLLTGLRLRTRRVFWNGSFFPFWWRGDCNLVLVPFCAVIGCFHQNTVCPTLLSHCLTY